MRRVLATAGIALAALGFFGGTQPAQADVCVVNALCGGIGGCWGTVNVCPTASSCSGTVNVCPGTPLRNCYGNVNVCGIYPTININCRAWLPDIVCDVLDGGVSNAA